MANAAGEKTATAEGVGPKSDRAEIEAQLERIKTDIADLTSTVSAIGRKRMRGAKSDADRRVAELSSAGEDMLNDLRRQLDVLELETKRNVQEKPLQTLGIAALAGFLLAMFIRR